MCEQRTCLEGMPQLEGHYSKGVDICAQTSISHCNAGSIATSSLAKQCS